jgi:hypothetical protein
LKLQVPALDQQSVSPLVSVIVTVVLLNVALMCTMPAVTLRRTLRFFAVAVAAALATIELSRQTVLVLD